MHFLGWSCVIRDKEVFHGVSLSPKRRGHLGGSIVCYREPGGSAPSRGDADACASRSTSSGEQPRTGGRCFSAQCRPIASEGSTRRLSASDRFRAVLHWKQQ